MLNDQEIDYILREYHHKMTMHEGLAFKFGFHAEKNNAKPPLPLRFQQILEMLKDGFPAFKRRTAERIFSDNPHQIFFNRCPVCNQFPRSKFARQCPCGYSWHHLFVAEFSK